MDGLIALFISFVREKALIVTGDRLLAAHSGGSDSTFLFETLLRTRPKLGFEFHVGHVNHGLRGPAADEDEEFVRRRCEENAVRFLHRTVSVDDLREREGISLEMASRKLRYDALEEMAVETGCNKVAFAHQADDRVETFFLRLLKGAGPDGLASIPLRRPMGEVELIRPLFPFSRMEIKNWLKNQGIEYRTDESNLDRGIARNAVREDLLPMIEERFNPSVRKAILQTIEALERDSEYLNDIALTEVGKRSTGLKAGLHLKLKGLDEKDIPVIVRMLLESFTGLAGEEYRCGYHHLMGAVRLWLEGKRNDRIDFPGGWTTIRTSDGLHLRATPSFESPPTVDELPIIAEGEFTLPAIFTISGKIIHRSEIPDLKHPPADAVYLNTGLAGKLAIDYNRTGRDIRIFGMGGHTRKVSDVLMEARVPLHYREWVPVLLDVNDTMQVMAIPHLNLIAENSKVGEDDNKVFVVNVRPALDEGQP